MQLAREGQTGMIEVERVSQVPNTPAVYAMYGGRGAHLYVAYVGVADRLRRRVDQHLVRRKSSVTTGISAVALNPEQVTELKWWTHERFTDKTSLYAAELVAFEALDPVLRSRGGIQVQAHQLAKVEPFHGEMRTLFLGPPAGRLVLPSMQNALDRIARLERRLDDLIAKHGDGKSEIQ